VRILRLYVNVRDGKPPIIIADDAWRVLARGHRADIHGPCVVEETVGGGAAVTLRTEADITLWGDDQSLPPLAEFRDKERSL
jgi:hypothetical protein